MKTLFPARLIATLVLLAVASACAGPPAQPTPTAAPTAAPSATPPPPSATPPSPSATPPPTPQPRALRMWVGEDEPSLAAIRALVSAYQRDGGPAVRVVAKSPDTLRMSVAGLALTGEEPPDLIWADGETLAGLLADGQLRPAPDVGDPLPGLLEDVSAAGERWGVPLTARGFLLLLYNRKIAAGPPATSDELIVRSRAGGAGLVMSWAEPRWLLPWLNGFGGAVVGPDGAPSLDTPAMRSALGLLRELAVAGPSVVQTYRGGQRWFGQGEVAFAVDGDWALPEYRTLTDTLDLGIAPLPVVPATGRRALPPVSGSFLMFWRDLGGAELARAEAFAAFLAQPATQARLAGDLGRLPASRQALGDAKITDPALSAAATMAAAAPGLPPTRAARCALFGIDVWLPSLLQGRLDQAETAANMQGEAEACVTR